MEPSDKLVDGIVKQIYAGYGGGTGFLFGIELFCCFVS